MEIKKEQLTAIQDHQKNLNAILNDLGYLEAQKHGLLHKFAEVNKEERIQKST